MQFQRATKSQARLRMALIGPSGSGKTYSALAIAEHIGARVALIDTEHGSASKYAKRFNFDVLELAPPFDPRRYVEAIRTGASAGYDVLIVDSLSHAWMGQGGALEMVDKAAARDQRQSNTFGAWREVTPIHNQLVEAMIGAGCHLIVTMRAKQGHVQEKDEKTGRTVVRKVGMEAIQRDGMEYEFDVVADMDQDNRFIVSKSRCEELTGLIVQRPGKDVADLLTAWLSDGDPAPPKRAEPEPETAPAAPGLKPTQEHLDRYQRGIRKAIEEYGLDPVRWELPSGATDADVVEACDDMGRAMFEAAGNKVAAS